MKMDVATFAAGCFWHVEEAFSLMNGVCSTKAGYCGGNVKNPTYKQVCSGTTNHAESVQIEYNPNIVSYETLLEKFWTIHDPTTVNRQGFDIGSQYRSIIFYHSQEQRVLAEESKKKMGEKLNKRISTSIEPIQDFYPAEEYHQKYIQKKKRANP